MRAITLLVCCLLGAQLLSAQGRFSFGLTAQVGLSDGVEVPERYSSFGTGHYSEQRGNTAMAVAGGGAWVNYELSRKFTLRSGLQYFNSGNSSFLKGYTETTATGRRSYYESTYKFRADQLQLPLEISISIGQGSIRPILSLGAQLSYEWLGTIYHENPAYRDDQNRLIISSWGTDNRLLSNYNRFSVQPVLGLGLRLNEQMSVRLRRTWSGREAAFSWQEEYLYIPETFTPGVVICGLPSFYRTRTTHRQTTTIEISYRLF